MLIHLIQVKHQTSWTGMRNSRLMRRNNCYKFEIQIKIKVSRRPLHHIKLQPLFAKSILHPNNPTTTNSKISPSNFSSRALLEKVFQWILKPCRIRSDLQFNSRCRLNNSHQNDLNLKKKVKITINQRLDYSYLPRKCLIRRYPIKADPILVGSEEDKCNIKI